MPARILVVDDDEATVKFLEAMLQAEYYDVSTAISGEEALSQIEADHPDIVLLDVLMPGMDGYEVCRRIKANPEIMHLPVVMVTALTKSADRVRGLEAGADDFLTKPVNDIALFARVRSLVRLKTMMDELRLREETSSRFGVILGDEGKHTRNPTDARMLVIDNSKPDASLVCETLAPLGEIVVEPDAEKAVELARSGGFDLIVPSLMQRGVDGLRLCSQLRISDHARQASVLALVDGDDTDALARALDIGVNDYAMKPIDRNELMARARTQIRRKRYQDELRSAYQQTMIMAVTDTLTGLHNRNYMEIHLGNLVAHAQDSGKPLAILMIDIDFFKSINDTFGHAAGDAVLRELGARIASNIRGIDLASRYGGEEFVVIMPDTGLDVAKVVAERLRQTVCGEPFKLSSDNSDLAVTISIGVAGIGGEATDESALLERTDQALYAAKQGGRNRVVTS